MSHNRLQPFVRATFLAASMRAVPIPAPFGGAIYCNYLAILSINSIGQQTKSFFSFENSKVIKFRRTSDSALGDHDLGTPVRFDEGRNPIAIRRVNCPNWKIAH